LCCVGNYLLGVGFKQWSSWSLPPE
jgi:hypothetical protein